MGALGSVPAAAQQARLTRADYGPDITVTATRSESDTFDVPSTVSVITADEIEENFAGDIKDLVRFEPGVSVSTQPSRFGATLAATGRDGNSGFNIRGLGGNRVMFVVDGVRVPEGFTFGPAAFGRGDYVDLDLLERIEILRGPASALYGSDGLAGAVHFITRDPSDMLEAGGSPGGRVRVSYASADESRAGSLSVAGASGNWEGLIAYSRRDARELDNQGDIDALNGTRTAPNPQDVESNAVLARVIYSPSVSQRFRFSYDYGDRSVETEAYSGRSATVLDLDGVDENQRQRFAGDHHFESGGGFIDNGRWSVFWQESNALQFSDEDRTTTDRTRTTTFDNVVWGGALQLQSSVSLGSVEHRFTYGGDFSRTEQEGFRDGAGPTVGDPLPSRPFPTSAFDLAGLFVQDEISLLNGQLVLFPALRYDWYELSPETDPLYLASIPPESQSDGRLSPKFGIVAWPTEMFGAFFNYAQGFRAPSPSEVNNSFENLVFGYTSLPNPELGPETSESVEVGVRFRNIDAAGAHWTASAAAFSAAFEDFISQEIVGGAGAPGDPFQFQFVNLSEVEIWGLEGRVDADWDSGFGLTFATSFAEGGEITGGAGAPLESVDPWKLVLGLRFDDATGRWGGQLIATHAAQKDDDETAAVNFRPDDFTILDATAYWNLTERATLRAGVFNITDEPIGGGATCAGCLRVWGRWTRTRSRA
jgi:hemoglobin/transferrin/lactoferrin receptor protein